MASKKRGVTSSGRGKKELVINLGSRVQWNAVRSPFRVGLLEIMSAGGSATAREMAELFDIDAPLVHYHLGLLEKAGLVESGKVPGRRGRVFSADISNLKVRFNDRSRVERERAERLSESWLRASWDEMVSRMHQLGKSGGGKSRPNILVNWESLSDREMKEVGDHFKSVDKILERARKRRRSQKDPHAQRANCHVVFGVLPGEHVMPPNPPVEIKSD